MTNSKKNNKYKINTFSLEISSKTWLKDSNELIDYDCEILIPSTIDIKKTSYIYRDANEIVSSEELVSNENDNDIEKLMKINVYTNNKDTFFEFERNKYEVDETDNIITPNTSWFLLKPSIIDPKMNRYKLNSGDIIKIGRITLRIRDMSFSEKKKNKKKGNTNNTLLDESNNLNDDNEMIIMKTDGIAINSDIINYKIKKKSLNLNNKEDVNEKIINVTKKKELKKNLSIFSKVEKKNIVCRICYGEQEDEQKDPLVQPCICDGSLKYIHLSCLKKWINTHSCVKLDSNEDCAIFLIKPVECELCKSKFPDFIKHQNKLYPLLDFTNDFKSYFTLESLTLDKNNNKFIYVVSLENNRKIKAGRGHECDILLSDISVSRIHCFFVVENKNVYLEDNDSKFGTLIFVQTPILKITQELPLFLQIGRTSLEISIKKSFKLFNCCEIAEKKSVFFYYNQNEKYIKDNIGLIVKDNQSESEESEYYYKNNNTQEMKNFQNNSIHIKEMDKMSDNEYLLIKHNKKTKDIKRCIFLDDEKEKILKLENKKNIENSQENNQENNNENINNNENAKNNESINNNNNEIRSEVHSININENNTNNNNTDNDNIINSNTNEEDNENLIDSNTNTFEGNINEIRNENNSTN